MIRDLLILAAGALIGGVLAYHFGRVVEGVRWARRDAYRKESR